MTSGPGLLPEAMSGSVVLLELESVLISMTHVAIKAIGMPRVLATICGHFSAQGS